MSTIYDKTDNYGLNLYGDNDPADLRDGYNGSMRTIDATMEQHLNRIEGVESRETHDEEVVKALLGDNTVDNATAAKTKWDKASADAIGANGKADDNTAILTALGADTTTHATASKTKWDKAGADATNATELLESMSVTDTVSGTALRKKVDATAANVTDFGLTSPNIAKVYRGGVCRNYNGTIFGFIGDSITEGYGATSSAKRWSTLVSQIFGATEKNVAVGGTGFTSSSESTRFDGQADSLIAAVGADAPVSIVFISGGVNDGTVNAGLGTSVLESTVNKVRTAWPLARIIVTIGLSGTMEKGLHNSNKAMRDRLDYYAALSVKAASLGCEVLAGYYMVSVNPSYSSNDGLHPNDSGYALIADFLASTIAGTTIPYDTQLKTMAREDVWTKVSDSMDISIDYSTVTISGKFNYTLQDEDKHTDIIGVDLGTILPSNRNKTSCYAYTPCGLNNRYVPDALKPGFMVIEDHGKHRNSLGYNMYMPASQQPSAGTVLNILIDFSFSTF